jgi:hypothetical protein
MPEYLIAPLDHYISVQAAAKLIAAERPETSFEQVMDTFMQAMFSGEFEPPDLSPLRRDEANWMLHLRIEKPALDAAARAVPLDERPTAYYAVGAASILRFLDSRRALPCDLERPRKQVFCHDIQLGDLEKTLGELASTPFAGFPEAGRTILGDMLMSRAHLRNWMRNQELSRPQLLGRAEQGSSGKSRPTDGSDPDKHGTGVAGALQPNRARRSRRERGRPPKRAWERIFAIARDIYSHNPHLKRSALAVETRRVARLEFDETDLPSVKTIERRMKEIIGPKLCAPHPDSVGRIQDLTK